MSTLAASPHVDADDNGILSVVKITQTDAGSMAEAQATNATVLPLEETSQSAREVQIIESYRVSMYICC